MAESATDSLLELLIKELLLRHASLIKDTSRVKIENLVTDLHFFKAFLRGTSKKRRENEFTQNVVNEIHYVVNEARDIIDAFVSKATVYKRPTISFWRRRKKTVNLNTISIKVERIKEKIQQVDPSVLSDDEDYHEKPKRSDFSNFTYLEAFDQPRPPRREDEVGFEDVTEDRLMHRLLQETDYFDVISVVGMAGIGKTTLALKVFKSPEIKIFFPVHIWLSIFRNSTAREIFIHMLELLTTINDDVHAKNDDELADLVAAHLETSSFLVVMDDVSSADQWERLCVALPLDNTKGKVLITSRSLEVGKIASKPRVYYNMRLLEFDERWTLLRLVALGTLHCPAELEVIGQEIAKNCEGLPLAVALVGGVLATNLGSDTIATRRNWEIVSKKMSSFGSESEKGLLHNTQKLISRSYNDIPYHLRPCFLYFGLFPEGYEIPVSKLIRMWIGEGFVQQEHDCSLEETAEKYLKNLIDRNFVQSDKFKRDGKVKTCRVHDIINDFCRNEAANENFLREIKCNHYGNIEPPIPDLDKYHRLSIHSRCLEFISSKRPFGHHVCSFVCFPTDEYVVSPENSTDIIRAFKLIRVLDVLPLRFTKIDAGMYDLLHLRYVAFSSVLSVLPSKFNQLENLETLIVDTTCPTLKVEADIWKMNALRHFETNASATLLTSTKSDKSSAELQTLGLISVESCTDELSGRAPDLKKLGIRGQLALLINRKEGSTNSLRRMRKLEKLKLINNTYSNVRRDGGLGCLPLPNEFPPFLKSLTLCGTFLSWEHMSTLGSLVSLKVLKLKDNAFSGSIWDAVDGGFQHLELLHIEDTNLFVWKATSNHYPKLRSLVLKYCEKLHVIPAELADIPSFQKLELYACISATKSAKDISDAKKRTLAEGSAFMLSIFPPIE